MNIVSVNFNKYLPIKNQGATQSVVTTSPLALRSLENDVFQHSSGTQATNGAIAFGSTDKDQDLIKALEETLKETCANYSKGLKKLGIKDIPIPTLKFSCAQDEPFSYNAVRNCIFVDLEATKKLENRYFLSKNNKFFLATTISDDGSGTSYTFMDKETAIMLKKANPGTEIHALGKDGARMFAQGMMNSRVTHWLEQMAIMNKPSTKEAFLDVVFKASPKLQETASKCEFDAKLRKTYPFLHYEPSDVILTFKPEIGAKKAVFTTVDMFGSFLWRCASGIDIGFLEYPSEITANAGAASYLKEKLGKGLDDEKLALIMDYFNTAAEKGYKIFQGIEKENFLKIVPD